MPTYLGQLKTKAMNRVAQTLSGWLAVSGSSDMTPDTQGLSRLNLGGCMARC